MHSSVSLVEYARRSMQRAYSIAQSRLRRHRLDLHKRSWIQLHARLASSAFVELRRSIPGVSAQYLNNIGQIVRPAPFTPAVTAVKLTPTEASPFYRFTKLLDTLGIRFEHGSQATSAKSYSDTSATRTASSAGFIPYAQHVAPRYRPPRNPVVLCHGLFGYDKRGFDALPSLQIHYWRGIKDALCRLGAEVYVARVSGANTIAKRANELHSALCRVLPGREMNFIAHSMGGLDVRYLASHVRPNEYRVSSLTTISTPHRGSPFMDWCRDNLHLARTGGTGAAAVATLVAGAHELNTDTGSEAACKNAATGTGTCSKKASLHTLTPTLTAAARQMQPAIRMVSPLLDHPAYANLTTSYLENVFNPNTPNHPDTQYFSFGARVSQLSLFHILRMPWEVVDSREGDNDGLVSVNSARWGKYLGTVDADHWELNNCWRWLATGQHSNFDVMEFYMGIATRLHQEGL